MADPSPLSLRLARVNADGLRDDLYRARHQLDERTRERDVLLVEVKALRAQLRGATAKYEAMANELERLKLLVGERT